MTLALAPVSDEQAKAIQQTAKLGSDAIDLVKSVGGYFGSIFGTLPQNLVGLLGADWVEFRRLENIHKMTLKLQALLEERNVNQTEEVSLSIGLPLMHAAAEEGREELQALWARLLAAAMDPSRKNLVRKTFINIIAQMDPLDARVFHVLQDSMPPSVENRVVVQLGISADAAAVSLDALARLGLISAQDYWRGTQTPGIRSLGRELRRALG